MTIFFSPSTCLFYDDQFRTVIPDDALEYTAEDRDALLATSAQGKSIGAGPDGYPVLVDPIPPSLEVFTAIERTWRDRQLAATDGVVSRHRDELEEGPETTLTPTQYAELQAYRRALRNWPEAGDFPLLDHRPPAPDWLAEQTQ